jgi:hypothetical protein
MTMMSATHYRRPPRVAAKFKEMTTTMSIACGQVSLEAIDEY